MNLEQLQEFCLSFPGATEDIKWEADLCFCVGEKMFCVTGADAIAGGISLKCTPENFADLTEHEGIVPARYLARYHWITIEDLDAVSGSELKDLILNSYWLVRNKIPAKTRNQLD